MYKDGQPAESLRDHARKLVLSLLIDHRENEKKKAKDNPNPNQTVVYSQGLNQSNKSNFLETAKLSVMTHLGH